ncbi:putative membrane protein [Babesia divergens]|uniref:Membrane protein n=1 Tax=Babesia divergens TaxID=32595 RepID=A0AAD9LH62_BABDI|nr:putative membrane protein [Babesia divergens]
MVSLSAKFLIATISLIFSALARELEYGNDQSFQPEARVNRTEVTLDLAVSLDMNMFEENLVQFKDFAILSISPKDSYIVLAVKDGDKVIYQCENGSNDYVYDVTLYNDGEEGCIIVFAEQGVSFFVKKMTPTKKSMMMMTYQETC